MKKGVIRPLKWFMKEYSDWVETASQSINSKEGTKSFENEMCFTIGSTFLDPDNRTGHYTQEDLKDAQKNDKENLEYMLKHFWSGVPYINDFCHRKLKNPERHFTHDKTRFIRKGLLTEFGRIYITILYYGVPVEKYWQMMRWVKNSFLAHQKMGIDYPHLEFAKVFRKVRQDYAYYFNNEDDLKLLILKNLFKDQFEKMLPPKSEEHQSWDAYVDNKYKERFYGMSKNDLIEIIYMKEFYIKELQSRLDEFGIDYLSEDAVMKLYGKVFKRLNEDYGKMQEDYWSNVKFTLQNKAYKLLK